MKAILFLFLIVIINSCGSPIAEVPNPPTKQSLATDVRNQTFAQLKKEKELYPFGTGSGMMDQIRMLALSFRYYKEVDINQARELLMTAGRVFINNVNSNEQIRPFLQNYPFKPNNIQISIYIQNPNGSEPDPGKLSAITMVNGVLDYMINDPETSRLKTVYKETFDEATEKLSTVAGL